MSRLQLLFACILLAGLCSYAEAGAVFYRDRSLMETAFGYLADTYFDLVGSGTPYYNFGASALGYGAIAVGAFEEFLTNPFLQDGDIITRYNFRSVGNTLVSEGSYFADYIGVQLYSVNLPRAFGLYVETGPYVTPASNEAMAGLVGNHFVYGSYSEGDFFGAAFYDIDFIYFAWRGVSSGEPFALSHIVSEPGYLTAGGDPHLVAFGFHSDMAGARKNEVFKMIMHPDVTTNAAIRSFDFLPESMQENNYFGTIGIQVANGDRVLIEAFEEDEQPFYIVTINGNELAFGTSVTNRGYDLHYNDFHAMPGSKSAKSEFERQFPYQDHNAVVRLHVPGQIVIDVSLSSKTAFVDWKMATPEVYRHTGAFLNVNMRDLIQPAESTGLLPRVGAVHQHMQRLNGAVQKIENLLAGKEREFHGSEEHIARQQEKTADHRTPAQLAEDLMRHRQALEDFDFPSAIASVVAEHRVEHIFS